ncbi:MAG: GH3 auxin-responsive promoter family protein [Bacteroidales bacterium]
MRILPIIAANSLIFLSTIKETAQFFFLLRFFRKVQIRKFTKLINKNIQSDYLSCKKQKLLNFPYDLPLTTWEDYTPYIRKIVTRSNGLLTSERVLLFEPTSGTTSATKYVPYTKSLKNEFANAIKPWLFGLYITWPKLFVSTQYWSISPATNQAEHSDLGIPIGFEQDSEYLGGGLSAIQNYIMVVPDRIKNVSDSQNWAYITAFYLLSDKKLGLISVWHPSFLTILIKSIQENYLQLVSDIKKGSISIETYQFKRFSAGSIKPNRRRAEQLESLDINTQGVFEKIWPRLQVISCWADTPEEPCLNQLKKIFPTTYIQAKGLIATEGIISFPFGKRWGIPAYRSHYLEFIDLRTKKLKALHQLNVGQKYEVVITTSGGLYRYKLNDIVQVTGMGKFRLPFFRFMHKSNYVSDIRGEKVSLHQVDGIFHLIFDKYDAINFLMLAPVIEENLAFYSCIINVDNPAQFPFRNLVSDIELGLRENYHYNYARELNQLQKLRVFLTQSNPTQDIISHLELLGTKKGDVKIMSMSKIPYWPNILKGKYL